MSEARPGGYEFVTTPCLWFSRGESRRNGVTKLLGAFELSLSGLTATLFEYLSQTKV